MIEQRLNRRQARHRYRRRLTVIERRGFGREVSRLDGEALGGRSVAVPVSQPIHGVAYGDAGRAVAERRDNARDLVCWDDRATVLPRTVHPRRRPVHFRRREAGGVNLNQGVPDAGYWVWRLLVPEALSPSSLVSSQCVHGRLMWARVRPASRCQAAERVFESS